jgi:lysophospholipase L1-like esterase
VGLATYVALGDSMSIDRYPDLDHAARQRLALPVTGLGAASLLARNDDYVWPQFEGRDLVTISPGIDCRFEARDGATTESVLDSQVDALRGIDPGGEALVTLTVGGNDLLALIGATDRAGQAGLRAVLDNLDAILGVVRDRLPRAMVLVANVYDPTDGTGDLEGPRLHPAATIADGWLHPAATIADGWLHPAATIADGWLHPAATIADRWLHPAATIADGWLRRQEMRWLDDYNAGVERLCRRRGARLIDLCRHFAGHGRSAPAEKRWYWTGSLIEPGMAGASEIRRLWLAAVEETHPVSRTKPPADR